jgi:hypothetical protein
MPTPGIKALRRLQLGAEATAGTSVAATAIWRGTGMGKDNRETTFVEEDIGLLGDALRTYVAKTGGEVTFEGISTFEQNPYFFQSGLYKTTPTTDTSSAQVWAWTIQNASTDPIATTDLQTYTVEFGDNQQAEYMAYCFTREMTLSGTVGEALNVSATMEGRTVGTTDFTPSTDIPVPTVESILFTNATLYIDPSSDTIGTTQASQTIFATELSIKTGWRGYAAADGRTDFSFVKRTKEEITLSVTFEHNTTAVAEKLAWRNQTERAIRVKFTGNALSTTDAGAPYDTKAMVWDLYGKWESFDALSDQDGNDQVTGMFRVGYSAAAGTKGSFKIINELSALP